MSKVKHKLDGEYVRVTVVGKVERVVREDLVEVRSDGGSMVRVDLNDTSIRVEYDGGEYEDGALYRDRMGVVWEYGADLVGAVWRLGGDHAHATARWSTPSFPVRRIEVRDAVPW